RQLLFGELAAWLVGVGGDAGNRHHPVAAVTCVRLGGQILPQQRTQTLAEPSAPARRLRGRAGSRRASCVHASPPAELASGSSVGPESIALRAITSWANARSDEVGHSTQLDVF